MSNDAVEFQDWMQRACADVEIDRDAALEVKTHLGGTGLGAARAVLTKSGNLWDNGAILVYAFIGKYPGTAEQQSKVAKVIKIWEQYANVTFVKQTKEASSTIRISFNPTLGSWSFVGQEILQVPDDQATMNLGWVSTGSAITDRDRGVILHEFGHVLGLMHEHQSPAREGSLHLIESAVINYYMATQRNWTADDVRRQILNVYNGDDISNYSKLDTKSIMMYFMPAEMDIEHEDVDPNYNLSEMDKTYIIINYPPAATTVLESPWSLDYALAQAGVDSATKKQIQDHYAADEYEDVRYHFTAWASATRQAELAPHGVETPDQFKFQPFCITEDPILLPAGSVLEEFSKSNDALWTPGTTISYGFADPSESKTYRGLAIAQVFREYQAFANIRFTLVTSGTPNVLISFITAATRFSRLAFSRIGTTALTTTLGGEFVAEKIPTRANLVFSSEVAPHDDPMNNSASLTMKRTIYHEVGHILGLHHSTKDDKHNTVPAPWDTTSVMLHPDTPTQESSLWETLKARFDPASGDAFVSTLSKKDAALLKVLYPRPESGSTFVESLGILGVVGPGVLSSLKGQLDQLFDSDGLITDFSHVEHFRNQISLALNGESVPPPLSSVDAPEADITPPPPQPAATTGSFLNVLLDQLNSIFSPAGNQIFSLQFPGRFLSVDQYAWDTTSAGIYGQFVKPTVVNESEFRLVDGLYDVGTVVGAPNGNNLSIVYEQCLNNLIPMFQSSPFTKQQDSIRKWLMKDVKAAPWIQDLMRSQHANASASVPANAVNSGSAPMFSVSDKLSEDNTINRIEMADILMQEYLTAKGAWEMERDKMIQSSTPATMESVTRTLAHLTPIREAQLAAKYTDAVVRGYSHTIRQYLGYMDIKSTAEFLQDAKDALRESSSSSMDGSLKVYPVQMQPIDWFVGCSTSFSMEDLTQDPDLMQQQINAKSQKLDVLNSRLAAIQYSAAPNMKDIQAKLDAAEAAYDTAQANLSKSYSSNVISLAQTCIKATGEFAMSDFVAVAQKFKIDENLFKDIDKGMNQVTDAQQAVTTASRAYTRLLSEKALAQATDTDKEKAQIQLEITSLTKELAELTARCASLRTKQAAVPPTVPASIGEVPIIPTVSATSGGSRWQEIIMRHEVASKYTTEANASHSKTSQSSCNLFFGSYHRSSSEADASSSSAVIEKTNTVEVGFRATLVTVDRAGWFQPEFFKSSSSFYHLNEKLTWTKWPDGITKVQDLKDQGDAAYQELNKHILPAYPVGFIICKDITIKIEMKDAAAKSEAANMESTLASSGGVLCWSTSSSEHNTSSSKSYSSTSTEDGMIIRIPGPQILGYLLQLTDNDETTAVPDKLPDDFLIPDDDYDAAMAAPSNTVQVPVNGAAVK